MDGASQRMAKRERKSSNRGKQSPYSSKHVRVQQAVTEKSARTGSPVAQPSKGGRKGSKR
jgi:hypothetical protein